MLKMKFLEKIIKYLQGKIEDLETKKMILDEDLQREFLEIMDDNDAWLLGEDEF